MNNDNFYSIDRLVEFGLGIAVAQQMVKSMNHVMQNAYVPGVQQPMGNVPQPQSYYAMIDNLRAGPFSEQEFSRLISDGKVTKATFVWRVGLAKWELASNVPDVLRLVALAPPPFTPE